MKNANVRVLVIVLALAAAVFAAAGLLGRVQPAAPETAGESAGVSITPQAPAADESTQAYIRVQVGGETWPLIPLTEGGEYTVTQTDKGAVNTIRTTATGAVMHFSTCDNQNCVQQREVTLANRDTRVMGSLIVCLPNEVIVELVSAEEVP